MRVCLLTPVVVVNAALLIAACADEPRPAGVPAALARPPASRSPASRVALLSFAEEEVELTLHPRGLGKRRAPTLEVRARYIFANRGRAAWEGPIVYPVYVTPSQPAPAEIELADGSRHAVRCGRSHPERCAAAVKLRVAPRSRRELRLRYLQPIPSARGPAVYMLTSGASWNEPIGRARLRVLVPAGTSPLASYPLAKIGTLLRDGRRHAVYGYQEEHLVPSEELRVAISRACRRPSALGRGRFSERRRHGVDAGP